MYRPLEVFIGLRYLRTKRQNHFISFISLISMLGIALGITTLITVISVMNGFEKELRARILGAISHATIEAIGAPMTEWPATTREETSICCVPSPVRRQPPLKTPACTQRRR